MLSCFKTSERNKIFFNGRDIIYQAGLFWMQPSVGKYAEIIKLMHEKLWARKKLAGRVNAIIIIYREKKLQMERREDR